MNIYQITIVERSGKRHRYIALAESLHKAWLQASNTYGLMALSIVKPWRAAA